jgi:hypothetical protein
MEPARFVILTLLILIPAIINLSTPLYNKIEPELLGIPFFIGFKRYGLPFVLGST